jgi:hypothetical protein
MLAKMGRRCKYCELGIIFLCLAHPAYYIIISIFHTVAINLKFYFKSNKKISLMAFSKLLLPQTNQGSQTRVLSKSAPAT